MWRDKGWWRKGELGRQHVKKPPGTQDACRMFTAREDHNYRRPLTGCSSLPRDLG
jgi:hypothetical protein